jgi:hypothetical protein
MTRFCIILFFVMLAPVITGADATQKGATELLARIDHLGFCCKDWIGMQKGRSLLLVRQQP